MQYHKKNTHLSLIFFLPSSLPIMLLTSLPPEESPSDVWVPSSVLDITQYLSLLLPALVSHKILSLAVAPFFESNGSPPPVSESDSDDMPSS